MRIKDVIAIYLKHMQTLGRSPYTIRMATYDLKRFGRYIESNGITEIEHITRDVLEDYQQELVFSLTAKGTPLSVRSQVKRLCTLKGFTRYLRQKDYLVADPGKDIILPKEPKRLPQSILDYAEVKRLMKAPDMRTNAGYRDRIMLEILYDTAIRRSELSTIKIHDLDLTTGFVKVLGKGDKERMVPVSPKVCELINNYLLAVRPSLLQCEQDKDTGYLILNNKGGQIKTHTIWKNIKHCARRANIKKNVTVHTFRHTCITHMLRNGAPIRHLQEMLGHESLESTQVYTHVTINDLKEVHSKYHPGSSNK